jgi:hypothetical protein
MCGRVCVLYTKRTKARETNKQSMREAAEAGEERGVVGIGDRASQGYTTNKRNVRALTTRPVGDGRERVKRIQRVAEEDQR